MIRRFHIGLLMKPKKVENGLIFIILALCVMHEGEHGVSEVEGGHEQRQISHDQTDLKVETMVRIMADRNLLNCSYHSLGCGSCKVVHRLVSMPVMKSCSGDSQPKEHTDNIHDGVG